MNKKVAIVAGSKSDIEYVTIVEKYLKELNINFKTFYISAHRNPEEVRKFSQEAKQKGFSIIIALAGYAAHLAGVIASWTSLPVIAVPLPASDLLGLDSLFSMVQMPGGVPVAVMTIGKAGAKNAAYFAKRIFNSID